MKEHIVYYDVLWSKRLKMNYLQLRRSIKIFQYVSKIMYSNKKIKVLDLGCGDGRFTSFLGEFVDTDAIELSEEAIKKGYKVIGLTASGEDDKQKINTLYNLKFNWYLCDEKALKTVVRSNPGILELDKGTVKQKVHWNDIDDLKL